jgi:hypothetical protein
MCENQQLHQLFIQYINPLAHTATCEAVWATDVFALSSSFLSVDGMTCHISFKAEKKASIEWCINISIVSIFRL